MRRLPFLFIAALVLIPSANASAAPIRCNKTHGTELAHSKVVKVYKVKSGKSFRFYGCAKPSGPVAALTKPFTGNQVKLVAAKDAYVAFTRTISGSDTVSVVDARTARQRHGLFPPDDIEFDTDPATPQVGAVRVNSKGEVVVSYIGLGDGSSTDSKTYIYAFDVNYNEQLLDSGPGRKIPPTSIKLSGEDISWTNGAVTRKATIGQATLSITSGGGASTGTVTTTPDAGIACSVAMSAISGTCIGSFQPSTDVTVVATGPATSTVTITGGCSNVHAPVAGQTSSVATCDVTMNGNKTVKVTIT